MKEFILKHAESAAEMVAFEILKHKFERLEEHYDEKSYEDELLCFFKTFEEYLIAKGIDLTSKK